MLQVGHPAPSFSLPDASMEMMHLSSYRGKKNVVLYFYPRDGTPGCTIQAIDFSDRESEFAKTTTQKIKRHLWKAWPPCRFRW